MSSDRAPAFDAPTFERELARAPNPLPVFRSALAAGRAALRTSYLDRVPATILVGSHARLVDELIERAWRLHAGKLPPNVCIALIAVGGYGRGELHPYSDVDLMLLLDKGDTKRIAGFVEAFFQYLWDMGLEVGHSVRTLADCVRETKRDVTVATNLMETRLLDGDAELFARMRATIGPSHVWPSRKFFAAKLEEQSTRHRRFNDTAYNLEPNIKDGPGGLRDIQIIAWVTQRHFGTTSLNELVERDFLSADEYRALMRGRNFLWRVRCGLHHAAGRREDRLLFDHQRTLSVQFGYEDKPGILAVEQFMKRYYRTIKELSLLNEILLQHFQEALLARGRTRIKPINPRFVSRNGYLDVANPRVFERTPSALLELFLVMQRHPKLKGVRAHAIRLLRANLHRIDADFRDDPACRSLFMEILTEPQGITHALRRMNAYDVLGAYLPVFGRIVGQMQHDLFHVYTVDQHVLFVLRNLRRLTIPQHRHELPFESELMLHIAKPERLYVAALFHDIAKGRGGDHSNLGADEAVAFCRAHGLGEYDTRLIVWLVRQHLIMSSVSQREDISDPDVVLRFAEKVGDVEHLDNLYLLTVADMRGTSPTVWNAWKGRLLTNLYTATRRMLRQGRATPIDLEAHVADLRREAMELIDGDAKLKTLVANFWRQFDNEYFLRHDASGLAWHARTIAPAPIALLPIVAARYAEELGGTEIMIFNPDREGLFAVFTAGLDRLNLSIMDARIYTTLNGFALDTFVVLDHRGRAVTDPRALAQLQQTMREQLLNPKPGRDPGSARLPRALKHFPIRTRVQFSASPKKPLTIMEVTAQDRPGLLYQVALALQHCQVNLVTAKVATFGERAEDLFFISTRDDQPVTDEKTQRCLESEIIRRLGGDPATGKADDQTDGRAADRPATRDRLNL